MNQTLLGSGLFVIGVVIAVLNNPLAKAGEDVQMSFLRPVWPLKWLRAWLVVGGILCSVIGLLIILARLS